MSGIPENWKADERQHLRFGDWRFFYIWDPEQTTSVSEDNAVLCGDERKQGPGGLAEFVADLGIRDDPDALGAEGLAERAGYFLVRGNSRRTCNFSVVTDLEKVSDSFPGAPDVVHPPRTYRRDGATVHESWLQLDTFLMQVVVTAPDDGPVEVDHSRLVMPA